MKSRRCNEIETLQCNVSTDKLKQKMTNKFQNKYRISSARLKNWDYGNNGAYFITICSREREHFFGEVESIDNENEMQFNEIGKLANKFWSEIPIHFPFVELGNYQVMPNHIHGILIINKKNIIDDTTDKVSEVKRNEQMSKISPKSGTIPTILRSYKSVVTKNAHYIHADFEWQERFHDHIIRDTESFDRIQNYIENNVTNWKEDKFYN